MPGRAGLSCPTRSIPITCRRDAQSSNQHAWLVCPERALSILCTAAPGAISSFAHSEAQHCCMQHVLVQHLLAVGISDSGLKTAAAAAASGAGHAWVYGAIGSRGATIAVTRTPCAVSRMNVGTPTPLIHSRAHIVLSSTALLHPPPVHANRCPPCKFGVCPPCLLMKVAGPLQHRQPARCSLPCWKHAIARRAIAPQIGRREHRRPPKVLHPAACQQQAGSVSLLARRPALTRTSSVPPACSGRARRAGVLRLTSGHNRLLHQRRARPILEARGRLAGCAVLVSALAARMTCMARGVQPFHGRPPPWFPRHAACLAVSSRYS